MGGLWVEEVTRVCRRNAHVRLGLLVVCRMWFGEHTRGIVVETSKFAGDARGGVGSVGGEQTVRGVGDIGQSWSSGEAEPPYPEPTPESTSMPVEEG